MNAYVIEVNPETPTVYEVWSITDNVRLYDTPNLLQAVEFIQDLETQSSEKDL